MPSPPNTIRAIHHSMRCLAWSLPGLIPIFGLPFAVRALLHGWKARTTAADWNPAAVQARWGIVLGSIGSCVSLLLLLVILQAFLTSSLP